MDDIDGVETDQAKLSATRYVIEAICYNCAPLSHAMLILVGMETHKTYRRLISALESSKTEFYIGHIGS